MAEFSNLTQEQLFQMLTFVLSGDNEKIKEATRVLKVYTKSVNCVGPLALIISQNENQSFRHLAGVLLKRNMATNYDKLDATAQTQLKQLLLERFFSEPVNPIRTSIGSLIGTIAIQTLGENKWPELFQVLQNQTAKNQDIVTRQRGLMLLALIFDYSGDSLKPFYSVFYPFFIENLQDSDKQIRVQTVKCLISLFDNIEHMNKQEAQQYKTLVEPILRFVDQCIKEGDEDNAYHCFDAFGYLAESKLTILDTHLGMIVEYAATFVEPQNECVLDLIDNVVEYHKKVLNKNPTLLKQLIECLSLVVAQPYTEEELTQDEEPLQDVTLWLLETLVIGLGKKKTLFGLFLETIIKLGFLILAAITEGLQDQIRRQLQNPIMNVIIPKGLKDERTAVRGAAIKCLSYFSEWLCPEILTYDQIVIPEMINCLKSTDHKIYEKALLTIDIFAENMESEKILPYMQTLLPSLVQLFLQQTTTFIARRHCLSSIGSIIVSSKEAFATYLKDVSELLLQVLKEKDTPEIMSIKSEAIQVFGTIAESFKSNLEVQNQLITPLAPQIFELLTKHEDFEIREACLAHSFIIWLQLKAMKFAPIFTQIISYTMKLAESKEGISYDKEKKEFSLDTESEDENQQGPMRVKVTQMDEKAAAIHALGQFALSVPQQFGQYFKPTFDILDETVDFFYDNIRMQTLQCYRDLIEGYALFRHNGVLPKVQQGLPAIENLDAEFLTFLQTDVMQKLIRVIAEDESYECAALAIDVIDHLTKKLGPQIVYKNLDDLAKVITLVLNKKIKCLGADLDSEGEEENDSDMNLNVLENLTDLIPTLAKNLKNGFVLMFREIFPHLATNLHKDKEIDDIICTIGCLAQIFEYESSLIVECQQVVLPFLLNTVLAIGDQELNRNAAYALATYCEFGPQNDVASALPQIIQTLTNIFTTATTYREAAENATAAVCRILIRFPQALPLETTLDHILAQLPFKGDVEENFTGLRFLVNLGNTIPDLVTPRMEQVIKLLLDSLIQKEHYKLKEEQLNFVVTTVKGLIQNQQYKAIIENIILNVQDQGQKNKVIALLQ
ncbi:unnamed protein product (macronuclear) [Paramecium tetraurelia]|uniref:Importin N-terminal domain-containing protein n=1 Tax=Paramecium tetraurelia TaxID=5888 RepID=A0BPG2_PARTE|nr:uncharacterized protein GSPATT00005178001 [Paramecium tetraurelia]CAK60429.1 unnamed protein product [Paramecium tetraurelia]|eukprot:XP_001427827.1 hypothetical protein (macronuclear) [Paramecium tetraurelia strain d4-2]